MQDLDDAVLRRFSKRIYVRLPGKDDRVQMLLKLLSKQYNDLSIHEVHQVEYFHFIWAGGVIYLMTRWRSWLPGIQALTSPA